MAAEIAEGWAPVLAGVELRSGSKGVFKVYLDSELVFDKAEAGRKPGPGEITTVLAARLGSPLGWRKSHAS